MPTIDNFSDEQLLESGLAGNDEAFARLYRRRQGNVFRFALQMSGSTALAEDVTQEVFLGLMRKGSTFDPERGTVKAFLLGIARNLVLSRLTRERFYVQMGSENDRADVAAMPCDKPGPVEAFVRGETIDQVRRAILSLPAQYREVVALCELQELSYAEAAVLLDCAIGTVRSRLHRGRALLSAKLRPSEEDEPTPMKSARCFA
jgi:RNA polymerase sigma-70 factor, ECF subfamily